MRRIALSSIALAAAVAVPAQAKPVKPPKAAKPVAGQRCAVKTVGFHARGALVDQTLTQSAGLATADRGDDRFSGTVTVLVTKANHRAPLGSTTFTLVDARVSYSDANGDGTRDQPAAGDRVKVGGKITRLNKRCDQTGFTPTVSVRKVAFKQPEAAEPTPESAS